ncbi:carboxyl transferase domain-containing protein [Kitasatospora sp. NPDC096147]|uniref:carboxyl transferase domain-containing protein n=1 Tax=Kitasatospora sp. NPDC096147 TaxID=3364093 RepID=UPI0037F8F8E9
MTAERMIGLLAETGGFTCWDEPVGLPPDDPDYRAALLRARERTGLDEAVTTGRVRMAGRQVALVVSEFGFLGGSIGVATAERITRAVERATAERLPLLALPVSGGTRMQEGTAAFLCMVRITAAVQAHRAAGLPYLTYLRNPTMGGVFASWGTLGHLVLAEPGARLGFLGPRVYRELRGVELPEEVQRAETLAAHGLIDAVVPPERLAETVARALAVLADPPAPCTDPSTDPPAAPTDQSTGPSADPPAAPTDPSAAPEPPPAADRAVAADAWAAVLRSRAPERPGADAVLAAADPGWLELASPGPALVRALARFDGQPALVVGQRPGEERPFTAAELRSVRRTARTAEQLGLPLVTLVDTSGAELSVRAELDGLALEIARTLETLVALRSPVLAVLLGQGSGGGALALLPADTVLAASSGWLAPLPPEGASAIVHRDGAHAAELARSQGIGAADLMAAGLVDHILSEGGDGAPDPGFAPRVARAVGTALAGLTARPDGERLAARAARHRRLGGG